MKYFIILFLLLSFNVNAEPKKPKVLHNKHNGYITVYEDYIIDNKLIRRVATYTKDGELVRFIVCGKTEMNKVDAIACSLNKVES